MAGARPGLCAALRNPTPQGRPPGLRAAGLPCALASRSTIGLCGTLHGEPDSGGSCEHAGQDVGERETSHTSFSRCSDISFTRTRLSAARSELPARPAQPPWRGGHHVGCTVAWLPSG